MELAAALILFDRRAMHPYDVANLAHDRALLKARRVDDNYSKVIVFDAFVSRRVAATIDDFKRADPLALVALDGICRVDDDAVDVDLLVELVGVQRVILHLHLEERSEKLVRNKRMDLPVCGLRRQ